MIILGLGCNIGDRLKNLREALARIRAMSEVKVLQVSPVYESDAMLINDSPDAWDKPFLNLAVAIETDLSPKQLLNKLKAIESVMGRVDASRWSPRIIDIDILIWHDEKVNTDKLTVPHTGIIERPFVAWPLADLVPDWKCHDLSSVDQLQSIEGITKKFGSRFDGKAPFHTKQIAQRIDTPLMMGILNITSDSFSDGGRFDILERGLEQAKALFCAGADIIDVGGESTRPGSKKVSVYKEWDRLEPFLKAWESLWHDHNLKPKLSVDTYKPEIAKKLLAYPIDYLNDVSGLTNPEMIEIVKEGEFKIIFMHNRGLPADPKNVFPDNSDVVTEVYHWGEKQIDNLVKAGIDKDRLIFDPGIGFGKNAEQSLALIKNIKQFKNLGMPILVGHSRKSFMNLFTDKKFSERDLETAVFSKFLADQGVDCLRVHDVDYTMRSLKLSRSLF